MKGRLPHGIPVFSKFVNNLASGMAAFPWKECGIKNIKGKHPKQMFQRRISQLVNVSIQAPASDISNTNITEEVMNVLMFDKLNSVGQMKVRPNRMPFT